MNSNGRVGGGVECLNDGEVPQAYTPRPSYVGVMDLWWGLTG